MAKVDLHIHSNFSDGSDSVEQLIENISKSGLEIFSLTDHDTIEGCSFVAQNVPPGTRFINGVELTCNARGIKSHILGYGYNPSSSSLIELIEYGKILRRNKLETRINYLKDVWGIELTDDELNWLYTRKSVVKTHIANVLVNRGLGEDNLSVMRKYLDGCKSGDTRFDGEKAIKVLVNSGAIPVWAHPIGGEGEKHLTPTEFLPKLEKMIECGVMGLECYYSRYSENEIDFLVELAKKYGLLISGGSDYHGSNKDIPILKLCETGKFIDSQNLTIIQKLM